MPAGSRLFLALVWFQETRVGTHREYFPEVNILGDVSRIIKRKSLCGGKKKNTTVANTCPKYKRLIAHKLHAKLRT